MRITIPARYATLVLGAGLSLLAAKPAGAAILTYDSGTVATTRADGPFTVGSLIQVGATAQLVTALGAQDAASSGGVAGTDGFVNNSAILVGIWDSAGNTLITSASVSTSSSLAAGNWRYQTLTTPVTLQANTQYLIGAFVGSGQEYFLEGASATPFSADTGFTLIESRFRTTTFGAPTTTGGLAAGRWGAANALTTPVPEPTLLGLATLGLTAGLLRRRTAAGR